MKTIGVIGGSTPVATEAYYRLINAGIRARLGGHHTAEIIINSMDFALSARFVQNERWAEGAAYLRGKALSLERAGADFVLCVSNTWHCVAEGFMEGVGVPLLHIAGPTGRAIRGKGVRRVGLLGTRATMGAMFMRERLEKEAGPGVEVVVPGEGEQEDIDRIIFEELSRNEMRDGSRDRYLEIVDEMVKERGVEGFVLGCTEIGLLIKQEDRPAVPFFDTLALHAEAAVEMALAGEE